MKKVLFLTNVILPYRIHIYNELAKQFNLTIACFKKSSVLDNVINTKHIFLESKTQNGFVFIKEDLHKLASKYDSVVVTLDYHLISYLSLAFKRNRTYSLTYWGVGVSDSYTRDYKIVKPLDKIKLFLLKRVESLIFYMEHPIINHLKQGYKREQLFVAHNTVYYKELIDIDEAKKNNIVFVGTLYKKKKIYDLLEAYKLASSKSSSIPYLKIVGDGEEREPIESWITENNLSDKISLLGAIFDDNTLNQIYQTAICCISPGQAGLTVLNAMANGVPFITTNNAVTGGERFNIENNVTGILYGGTIEELSNIIYDTAINREKYIKMGRAAQKYFVDHCSAEQMVNGWIDAVNYAYKIKHQDK